MRNMQVLLVENALELVFESHRLDVDSFNFSKFIHQLIASRGVAVHLEKDEPVWRTYLLNFMQPQTRFYITTIYSKEMLNIRHALKPVGNMHTHNKMVFHSSLPQFASAVDIPFSGPHLCEHAFSPLLLKFVHMFNRRLNQIFTREPCFRRRIVDKIFEERR